MPCYSLNFMLFYVNCKFLQAATFRLQNPVISRSVAHRFNSYYLTKRRTSSLAFISKFHGGSEATKHIHSARAMTNQDNVPGLSFATDTQTDDSNYNNQQSDDNDVSKWEKMYYSAPQQTQQFQFQPSDENEVAINPTTSDIRVITFDLDNTLWKTGPTISHANKLLNEHVQSLGVPNDTLVEKEMGKLFESDKRKYAGGNFVEDEIESAKKSEEELVSLMTNVGETEEEEDVIGGNVKDDLVHIRAASKKEKIHPVYLTMLRKDAIRSLLHTYSNLAMNAELLENEVEKAFQLWMAARVDSITQNYANNVLATLSTLRTSLSQSSKFDKVYIGAITDGNSDPTSVPLIGEFFDFVIRAEDVGVSKPDGRVYKAAVAELMVTIMKDGRSVENFFLGEGSDEALGATAAYIKPWASSWKDVEEDAVEAFSEAVGPWWVHIGDDFFKDVVASKGFRMRSIWVRELIAEKFKLNAKEADTKAQQVDKRTLQDLEKEITKQQGVLKMAIGESEFLANSLHEEFSDAILEQFDELADLLVSWHEEGLREQATSVSLSQTDTETPQLFGSMGVDVNAQNTLDQFNSPSSVSKDDDETAKKKFCVYCGEQLPSVAKFCSGCGEKQP